MKYEYISEVVADRTKYTSLYNAYQKNDLSIVLLNDEYFYFEHCPGYLSKCAIKEVKRIFPGVEYLGDINTKR